MAGGGGRGGPLGWPTFSVDRSSGLFEEPSTRNPSCPANFEAAPSSPCRFHGCHGSPVETIDQIFMKM